MHRREILAAVLISACDVMETGSAERTIRAASEAILRGFNVVVPVSVVPA